MALTKTLWTTIVDLVSTGQNVSDNLDTAFTNIDVAIDSINADAFDNSATPLAATTRQDAIVELANVGYAHMILSTPYTVGQTLSTTPVKISAFDTIHHNVNGAITPTVDISEAIPAHKFTINKSGRYRIYGTLIGEFSQSNDITIELYKNGVASGAKVNLQGRGANKAVQFTFIGDFSYIATDYLELYAYADAAGIDLMVTGTSMIVERKPI